MTEAWRYKLVIKLLAVIAGLGLCGLRFLDRPGETPPAAVAHQPASSEPHARAAVAGVTRDAALAGAGIAAELNALAANTDSGSRERFNALICRWAKMDKAGAFDFIDSLADIELRCQGRQTLIELLVGTDPTFLGERLLAEQPPDADNVRLLARLWAQTDARGALAWAQRLPEVGGRDDALVAIRSQLAAADPVAASQMVAALPESSSTAALVVSVAAHWGASDVAGALSWADSLPESEKTLAIPTVTGDWAQHDPVAAGSYVAQLPPGPMQDQAAQSVVAVWAQQDPAATAAWVLQFPAGDLQEQAIRRVVSAWNDLDPSGFQDWAYHYPASAARDIILRSYVESLAYQTPDQAVTVAGWINDPLVRQHTLETLQRSNSAEGSGSTEGGRSAESGL